MAETSNGRVTTASVDRRVEGLEKEVADLKVSVALVEQEQKHIRELMASQFSAIEANIKALSARMEVMSNQLNDALSSERDIERMLEVVSRNEKFIQQFTGGLKAFEQARLWLFGGGVFTFVIAVLSLLHSVGFWGT